MNVTSSQEQNSTSICNDKNGVSSNKKKENGTGTETKNDNGNNDSGDEGPGENDLVIRDGFPALRISVPGTDKKWKPFVQGDEPIPRHSFWSHEEAIHFHPDHLPTLLEDCETVFTARDKPDGNAYSAGQTFFIPANKKPRCALEALALSIFHKHVKHLEEGTYDPAISGANWWTLVLEGDDGNSDADGKGHDPASSDKNDDDGDEDEVGLHFDADYELEEQTTNLLLHPRVGTITYLSNYGAPTLILDQKSPPMDDEKKKTLEQGISKAWLSHPKLGKHTAFDGRLLHGAPALYFPSRRNQKERQPEDNENDEPAAKRQKIHNKKRYTVLVNIWLNHWVMDAALLDDEVCAKLKTPWEPNDDDDDDNKSHLKRDDSYVPPFTWNRLVDLAKPSPQQTMKIKLSPSQEDPAGEDELALCNHAVTIKYNPTMEECHEASSLASLVELELEKGAITLHVGDDLPDASDDE